MRIIYKKNKNLERNSNDSNIAAICENLQVFLPVISSNPIQRAVQLSDVSSEQNVIPNGQFQTVNVADHTVGTQEWAHTKAHRDGDVLKAAQKV